MSTAKVGSNNVGRLPANETIPPPMIAAALVACEVTTQKPLYRIGLERRPGDEGATRISSSSARWYRPGDIITAVNGIPVKSESELR